MITGNNSILNQYVPTFIVKSPVNGQSLVYDSTIRAFVNSTNVGDLSFLDLNDTADLAVPDGYVKWDAEGLELVYSTSIPVDSVTGLAGVAISGDYDDLLNKPNTANIVRGQKGIIEFTAATPGTYNVGSPIPSGSLLSVIKVRVLDFDTGTGVITVGNTGDSAEYIQSNEINIQADELFVKDISYELVTDTQITVSISGGNSASSVLIYFEYLEPEV